MGLVPLQYLEGQNADSLELTGKETYSIELPTELKTGHILDVKVKTNYCLQPASEAILAVIKSLVDGYWDHISGLANPKEVFKVQCLDVRPLHSLLLQ